MARGWAVKVNGTIRVGTVASSPRSSICAFLIMTTGLAVYVDELSEDELAKSFKTAGRGVAELIAVDVREIPEGGH